MKKYSFDYEYFAKKLDELIKVNDEKSISYSEMFLVRELEAILETAYDFNSQIPGGVFNSIIVDGIHIFVRKNVKDGKALKASIKQSEEKYLRRERKKYHILTSLSFQYFNQLPKLNINDVHISFLPHLPRKFRIYDNENIKYDFPDFPPKNYTIVKISLQARSPYEAVEMGLVALNCVRGLWNFSINIRLGSRIQHGKRDPINSIRLGPLHTLHDETGKLSENIYWFENEFINKSAGSSVKDKWHYISKDFIHFRKCIKNSKSKIDINSIINYYTNALDTNDYHGAYLKLWSLLEQLTATGSTGYDKTIARTLFFYKNDKLNKEALEHLRIVRNRLIHKGESPDDIDPIIFQMKRYVERLFLFHINNLKYFFNIQEVGQYLDINYNTDTLKREIKFRKRVLKEIERKRV
jgi:hypothetical protein